MPAPFDTLKPFSFSGVPIPYKSYRVKGSFRKHVHEMPHASGGIPEKLGRSLYEVTVAADFNSGLDHPNYNHLLLDLNITFHTMWEQGQTAPLHVPHIGTFNAFADEWTEDVHNTNRSGVMTEIKFIEDPTDAYLVFQPNIVTVESGKKALKDFNGLIAGEPFASQSIFSSINDIALTVFAISDQFQLYGSLIAAKFESLNQLLRHTDNSVRELGDAQYWQAREAFDRLRETVQVIYDHLAAQDRLLREYEVVFTMSIGQIAAAIYGDYTRGGELMQLNILPDPLQVSPGTVIRYFQAA